MRAGPVLGIETSCDETAAAVLDADGRVLAEAVLSQEREHAAFGGVVPEIAARAHLAHLPALVGRVMANAGVGYPDLACVAATAGPGLIGGLIVGSGFGQRHRDRPRTAVCRGKPSRSARAHRPAPGPCPRWRPVSLSAPAGVGRALPVHRRGRGRVAPAARRHGGRCGGRGVRQGGQVARARLGRAGRRSNGWPPPAIPGATLFRVQCWAGLVATSASPGSKPQ